MFPGPPRRKGHAWHSHHQLNQLVGEWEGVTRTWLEPGKLADESPCRGTIRGYDVLGSYGAPSGPPWGWRTELQLPEPDRLLITHYNVTPEGQEAKGVETEYRRKRG